MALDTVLLTMAVGLSVGGVAALLGKLGSDEPWDNRKFSFAVVVGAIAGLGVVEGIEGGVLTEDNIISVVLAIFGGSFLTSKSVSMLGRLRGN